MRYPVPREWETKYGIRRYGFHGASHRFVTQRCAELRGTDKLRIISCHLGGSSSIAAVRDGKAIDSSWGMTPQSGLPQNNRVGDFDVFALIYLARDLGLGIDAVEKALTSQSGLKGLSGLATGDIRDLLGSRRERQRRRADRARCLRRRDPQIHRPVPRRAERRRRAHLHRRHRARTTRTSARKSARTSTSAASNSTAKPTARPRASEAVISTPRSKIEVRVIPTNEELIIARNAWAKLSTPQLTNQHQNLWHNKQSE